MNHRRLYIGDLSPEITLDELNTLLTQHGQVENVQLNEPSTHRIQRFAIVEMREPEQARAAAKALNGMVLHNYRLIAYTVPPKSRPRGTESPS